MVISRKNLIFDIIFTICSITSLKMIYIWNLFVSWTDTFRHGKEVKTYADTITFSADLHESIPAEYQHRESEDFEWLAINISWWYFQRDHHKYL